MRVPLLNSSVTAYLTGAFRRICRREGLLVVQPRWRLSGGAAGSSATRYTLMGGQDSKVSLYLVNITDR